MINTISTCFSDNMQSPGIGQSYSETTGNYSDRCLSLDENNSDSSDMENLGSSNENKSGHFAFGGKTGSKFNKKGIQT